MIDGFTSEQVVLAQENLSKAQEDKTYSIEKTIELFQQTSQLPVSSEHRGILGRDFYLTQGKYQQVKFHGETYRLGITPGGTFTIGHIKNNQETTYELERIYPIKKIPHTENTYASDTYEQFDYILHHGISGKGIQEVYVKFGILFVLYEYSFDATHTGTMLIPLGEVEDIKEAVFTSLQQQSKITLSTADLSVLVEYVAFDKLNFSDDLRGFITSCSGLQAVFNQVEK